MTTSLSDTFVDAVTHGYVRKLHADVRNMADTAPFTEDMLRRYSTTYGVDLRKKLVVKVRAGGSKTLTLGEADLKAYVDVVRHSFNEWVKTTTSATAGAPVDEARAHFFKERLLMALAMLDAEDSTSPVAAAAAMVVRWWNPLRARSQASEQSLQGQWKRVLEKHKWKTDGVSDAQWTALANLVPDPSLTLVQHTPTQVEPSDQAALHLLSSLVVAIYREVQNDLLVDRSRVLQWLQSGVMPTLLPKADTTSLHALIATGHNFHVSPILCQLAARLNITLAAIHLPSGALHWGIVPVTPFEQGEFHEQIDNPVAPLLDPWLQRVGVVCTYTDTTIGRMTVWNEHEPELQRMQQWQAHLLLSLPESTYEGFRDNVLYPLALYYHSFRENELTQFQQAFRGMFEDLPTQQPEDANRWVAKVGDSHLPNYEALQNALLSLMVPSDARYAKDAGSWALHHDSAEILVYEKLEDTRTTRLTIRTLMERALKVADVDRHVDATSSIHHLVGESVYDAKTARARFLFTWPPLTDWDARLRDCGVVLPRSDSLQYRYLDYLFTHPIDGEETLDSHLSMFEENSTAEGVRTFKENYRESMWKIRHIMNTDTVLLFMKMPVKATVLKNWFQHVGVLISDESSLSDTHSLTTRGSMSADTTDIRPVESVPDDSTVI
jgi:hypothetical protein